MRYDRVPSQLFIENRKRFAQALPAGAMCIIHANDIPQTNGDGTRSFIQNSNLFWLTGIDQEESIAIIFPDSPVAERQEVLFIRETNAHIAVWEGNRLRKDEATQISGIATVLWTSSFEAYLKRMLAEATSVFLSLDQHPGRTTGPQSRNHRFAKWFREEFPTHDIGNADSLLGNLRMTKSAIEIDLMRRACDITRKGFIQACKAVRAGAFEYAIEAEYAHTFIANGARGFAYEPIIASGENSCILHYIANDQVCKDGDVLLMDVGAAYANYCADMTRTIPVNGRFTARQRAVYTEVLKILRKATALMKPGVNLDTYHAKVGEFADEALLDLGLMTSEEFATETSRKEIRGKYFLHRTAHFLGLDVHDTGDNHADMAPGMVLTCEPGIYIREEDLGVRLENNILITDAGNIDLMADIPIEIDEIEQLIGA